MEYESSGVNAKSNAALTTGIIGTALGVMNGGLGLLNGGLGTSYHNTEGGHYVTKDELNYVQTIGAKDSEIALLKSEQNTEIKIADVYERIMTRVNADRREQDAWNSQQMVNNSQMASAIATNSASIAALQNVCGNITKTVIPINAVCPEPMAKYNSWVAPTT